MPGKIVPLIKGLINYCEQHKDLFESLYYLSQILDQFDLVKIRDIWLSIEWSRLIEQSHYFLTLAERYIN